MAAVRRAPGVALLALLLTLPVLAGCLTPPDGDLTAEDVGDVVDEWLPRLFDGYEHQSVDVPVEGVGLAGIEVHIDLWVPTGGDAAAEGTKFPVIVDAGPYFGTGKQGMDRRSGHYVHDYLFEHMVPRGYAVAAVETPGSAGSSGCWDFMGPQETAAMAAAVDWLGSQAWSNGKVGMIGKSYDGMTQIMAASKHPEHLATIVPVAPLTHAYAGVYMNGVPYGGFWPGAFLSYTVLLGYMDVPVETPERVPNSVTRNADQTACVPDNWGNGVLNDGDYNAYYQERDFRPSAATIDIPVFFMQGFLDGAVKADNALPYVNDLAGPKMVWLGQWDHDYANATFAGRDDMYIQLTRWFDHWLLGVENGIESDLGFHVQDSEGRWRREANWPPADTTPVTFRLADGALAAADATGRGAAFLDDGYAYWTVGEHRPEPLDSVQRSYLVYTSDPMGEDLHVAGPVALSVNASSSGTRGRVVAELLDCDAGAIDCTTITRGAMSLRHTGGLEEGRDLTPGEVVTASFTLHPRDYVVAEGRTLVLVVAGVDDRFFEVDATRNLITLHEGADAPSSLTLPAVDRDPADAYLVGCGVRIDEKPCYDGELRDRYPE